MRSLSFFAVATTLLSTVCAQTYTDCDPLKRDDCPAMPALGSNATFYFNTTISQNLWNTTSDGVNWDPKGLIFAIKMRGDSPTIRSKFHIFFGRVSVIMKPAKGRGIVSSFILQSDDLDEIDWEWLGGNATHSMTNYYGKGNTTYDPARGEEYKTDSPLDTFHNYTIDWTKERIEWWIDGTLLRTMKFEEAQGGDMYPQTPMTIRMGNWAGGDTKNNDKGVVEWAGGETNFKEAPFVMTVKEAHIQDYSSGSEYLWGDRSGSWQSIKVVNGTSKAVKEILKPHGVTNRWASLSSAAKIGIYSAIGAVSFICFCLLLFCCIKQRRAGRREHMAHELERNKEIAELLEYKKQMAEGRKQSSMSRSMHIAAHGVSDHTESPARPERAVFTTTRSYGSHDPNGEAWL